MSARRDEAQVCLPACATRCGQQEMGREVRIKLGICIDFACNLASMASLERVTGSTSR